VHELIKNLDKEKVTLNGFGDETDASEVDQAEAAQNHTSISDPQKTVSAMAKRAASNRD
jgi:hypothetical protein